MPNYPQHTQTSDRTCLHTSCNLHFSVFSAWLPLHTRSIGKRWSLQSCFPDSVFTLEGRCSNCRADVEAATVGTHWFCSVLLCSHSLTPPVSALPVVVKIIDGCLMETSLTSLQHDWNHGGALSQHSCVFIFFFLHLPLTLAQHTANPSGDDN